MRPAVGPEGPTAKQDSEGEGADPRHNLAGTRRHSLGFRCHRPGLSLLVGLLMLVPTASLAGPPVDPRKRPPAAGERPPASEPPAADRAAEGPAPRTPGSSLGDDFRVSDPQEADLGEVADSSGMRELAAAQPRSDVLAIDEVLDSLVALDPRLEAAQRKLEAAEGKLLSARGGFDTKVKVRGLIQPISYYEHGIVDVKVEQPTPFWGLGVWAGWRLGLGEFAVYDGKLQTAQAGEVSAGVTLPLWQDGPIDRRRADLRQARIAQDQARLERDAKQLELEFKAAEAYWKWVATGLKLEIERTLLALALERDTGLRRQIELGSREAIVGVDNRRTILSREARVVAAERRFQEATLKLSLYYRDAAGEPVLAGLDRLPRRMPAAQRPGPIDIPAEVTAALERRPDLLATLAELEQAEIELEWSENQLGPRIDLSAWVSQDLGPGPESITPTDVTAAIEVELPIPMRKARGRVQGARAEVGRIQADLRYVTQAVTVDVRDAHTELAASFQRARLAGEQVDLARAVAEAELRRFDLGAGDLLLVNLREVSAADAASSEVDALASYHVAIAALRVALGLSPR